MSNVGFRIYDRVERPSKQLIMSFAGIPVANISDNMGRIACLETQIKPFGKSTLLGTAVTVRVPAGDNLMLHKAIDMAEPGDVIVVDGESCMGHALMGEIMFRYAIKRGVAGFVLDGCIRDVDSLSELDFPVFARGVNPRGPYKNGPGEINAPICCGGQVINPGDIIIGDSDGVVVIKPDDARDLLEKARKHNDVEKNMFKEIEDGTLNRDWVEEILREKGCEIIT